VSTAVGLAARVDVARAVLGDLAREGVPLAPLTTYRVGGAAALFAEPGGVEDLHRVGEAVAASGLPVLVVGRGSNLLVSDRGFPGIACSVARFAAGVAVEGTDVHAGGAVPLPVLARRTAAAGLTGFEWAVGVPGTVGGGVRMNAGGHGSDMAASLVDVDVYDVRLARRGSVPRDALGLRFRGSDLADHQVVVGARLALGRGDPARSQAAIDEVVRWRREHQPGGQNAGSVFVNPVPGVLSAGELVDRAGLRGHRLGTAHVSEKHANFIQADEGGSAQDVRALIELVRATVAEATGYVLRSEVRLVGFDDLEPDDRPGVVL